MKCDFRYTRVLTTSIAEVACFSVAFFCETQPLKILLFTSDTDRVNGEFVLIGNFLE